MLAKSYWVRFAPVVSLCLSCQLPMPSVNAPSPPLASQDLLAFNHGRRQAQPPHASACPQGIGRWYWHAGGRQFVCGGQSAAQATVWEVFKKRPADELYVCLWGKSDSLVTTNLLWWLWKVKHLLVSRYRDSRFSILKLTFEVLYSQCALVCWDNVRSK